MHLSGVCPAPCSPVEHGLRQGGGLVGEQIDLSKVCESPFNTVSVRLVSLFPLRARRFGFVRPLHVVAGRSVSRLSRRKRYSQVSMLLKTPALSPVMPLNASHSPPFFVGQDPVRFRMPLASLKNSQFPKLSR